MSGRVTRGMLRCEHEWTPEKAAGVQALVRAMNGGVAPCETGLPCPLLPPRDTGPQPRDSLAVSLGAP